jgi:hypothetical protein
VRRDEDVPRTHSRVSFLTNEISFFNNLLPSDFGFILQTQVKNILHLENEVLSATPELHTFSRKFIKAVIQQTYQFCHLLHREQEDPPL